MQEKSNPKEQNRKEILELAGSWEDMGEEDFKEFIGTAKKEGKTFSASMWNYEASHDDSFLPALLPLRRCMQQF
ncbi:MAG: hypothetical protein AAF620_18205 [Bacteroidota bacterium]